MNLSIHFILMLIAVVLLLCAAIGKPAGGTVSLGWLGMFFWGLTLLIR